MEPYRWSSKAVLGVRGTPHCLKPSTIAQSDAHVEEFVDPHANRDAAVPVDDDLVGHEDVPKLDKQIRITMKDLQTFGFSDRCPRCAELRAGNSNTQKHHSQECRLRLYLCFQSSDHPKWQAVRHFFQDSEPNAKNVDAEGALRHLNQTSTQDFSKMNSLWVRTKLTLTIFLTTFLMIRRLWN